MAVMFQNYGLSPSSDVFKGQLLMSRHSGHNKTASRLPVNDEPAGVQEGAFSKEVKQDRFQQRVLSVGAAQQNQRQSRMFYK